MSYIVTENHQNAVSIVWALSKWRCTSLRECVCVTEKHGCANWSPLLAGGAAG